VRVWRLEFGDAVAAVGGRDLVSAKFRAEILDLFNPWIISVFSADVFGFCPPWSPWLAVSAV
jgi:hypothetical protein